MLTRMFKDISNLYSVPATIKISKNLKIELQEIQLYNCSVCSKRKQVVDYTGIYIAMSIVSLFVTES